jgi:hypothetical protein
VLLQKYIKANTLYAESGPVIETPLAAMASIQELCMQYWNGVLRVFPAIPHRWKDVSFTNFLTDGGNLVSAERKNGKTANIRIKSQYGGRLCLKSDIGIPEVKIQGKGTFDIRKDGTIDLKLDKGAIALINVH